MKKNASECSCILLQVYEYEQAERTCHKWLTQFKRGDFNLNDKEQFNPLKKFEDEKLERLANENPWKSQEEFANTLGVTQQTVSRRLKAVGIIRKCAKWITAKKI